MVKKLPIIMFILIFSLGWVASSLFSQLIIYTPEKTIPFSVMGLTQSVERVSPSDHIRKSQIHVFSDRIELDVENAIWSEFTNTNSMDPVIDEHSNGIEIVPQSSDEIHIGDVISYKSLFAEGTLIHRVISKGEDGDGVFFIVKGDNNPSADPGKIRFDQVKGILVGIIY